MAEKRVVLAHIKGKARRELEPAFIRKYGVECMMNILMGEVGRAGRELERAWTRIQKITGIVTRPGEADPTLRYDWETGEVIRLEHTEET